MKDLGSLNQEQRDFIKTYIKRTPRDLWLEKLTELKGIEAKKAGSEEQVFEAIEQWELIEIKAAAGDKRPYKCICGRSLKY